MTESAPAPGQPARQRRQDDELAELLAVFAADTDVLYRPWLEANLPAAGSRAVDLGCGSGRWTGLLAGRYLDVLAVDTADREIDRARAAHPSVTFEVRSPLDVTRHRDGLFDLVLTVNALHRLGDHHRALRHLRSLVAPGGTVIAIDLTDPGGWATLDFQIRDAFLDAEESYRHRSRDHRIAAKVLELRLHPLRLEQALSDGLLTRPAFRRHYAAAFPGAAFADLHHAVTAMRWTRRN